MVNTTNRWHSQCVPGTSGSKTALVLKQLCFCFDLSGGSLKNCLKGLALLHLEHFQGWGCYLGRVCQKHLKANAFEARKNGWGNNRPTQKPGRKVWSMRCFGEWGFWKVATCFWEFTSRRPCTYAGWAHAQKRPENVLTSGFHQALHKQEGKAEAELSAVWLSVECMSQHTHIHTVHLQRLGYFSFSSRSSRQFLLSH